MIRSHHISRARALEEESSETMEKAAAQNGSSSWLERQTEALHLGQNSSILKAAVAPLETIT